MKFLILVFLFITSSAIFAEDSASKFCASEVMKKSFYNSFYSAKTLKYKFTSLYKEVDKQLGEFFQKACKSGEVYNLPSIAQQSLSICISTCDKNADKYTDDKIFGKKEMANEVFNECASMCNSMNSGYEGYILGFADANKDQSSDCTNASKDSISNLANKVKNIQQEINNSPVNSTKAIQK